MKKTKLLIEVVLASCVVSFVGAAAYLIPENPATKFVDNRPHPASLEILVTSVVVFLSLGYFYKKNRI
jgi:hypothetical protein